MSSNNKKGGGAAVLQKDAPWRASSSSSKPVPKIHHSPLLRLPQNPFSNYALSVMKVLLQLYLYLLLLSLVGRVFSVRVFNCWVGFGLKCLCSTRIQLGVDWGTKL